MGPWEYYGVGKIALCCSGFALRVKRVMGRGGSSAHSFGPVSIRLGMDTPWSDMGKVRLRFAAWALCKMRNRSKGEQSFLHLYAFQSIASRLRHTFFLENFRELLATREVRNGSKGVKNFFLHFYAFQNILSRLRHTFFFSKIFVSAKRARARCERKARSPRERSDRVAPQG